MRKVMIAAAMLLMAAYLRAEVLSVDPAATPKPMKVTVEGVEDATPTSLTTQKEVFFKNEFFMPNTKNSVAAIKVLASKSQKNTMEAEVVDAIISKLADMEETLGVQQAVNTGLFGGLAVLLVAVMYLIIRKKK
jgi:hypothetical protein